MNRILFSIVALFAALLPLPLPAQVANLQIASVPIGPQPGITSPTDFVINPVTKKAYILGMGMEVVDLNTNTVVNSIQLAQNPTAGAGTGTRELHRRGAPFARGTSSTRRISLVPMVAVATPSAWKETRIICTISEHSPVLPLFIGAAERT